MKSFLKSLMLALLIFVFGAMSACTLGQAVEATSTPVDVNAVMTAAAATAFVQLSQIAGQASPTSEPSQTPTSAPPTNTPDALAVATTQPPALQLLTPTSTDAAGGLPAVETPIVSAGLPTNTPSLVLTLGLPLAPASLKTPDPTCFDAEFVADISILDGTVLKPDEKFTKIWRIQNTGLCAWDEGFGLTFFAGDSLHGDPIYFSVRDQPVAPGGIVDLGIQMRAPSTPGDYVGHWTMINDQGTTFGRNLIVFIKVAK